MTPQAAHGGPRISSTGATAGRARAPGGTPMTTADPAGGTPRRPWTSAPTRSPPTTPRTGTAATGTRPRRRACPRPSGRGRRNPRRHPTRSRPRAPRAVAAARGRPPTSSTRAHTQAAGGGPGGPSTASPTTRTPGGTTALDAAGAAPPLTGRAPRDAPWGPPSPRRSSGLRPSTRAALPALDDPVVRHDRRPYPSGPRIAPRTPRHRAGGRSRGHHL